MPIDCVFKLYRYNFNKDVAISILCIDNYGHEQTLKYTYELAYKGVKIKVV